jgi:hypothetical protein
LTQKRSTKIVMHHHISNTIAYVLLRRARSFSSDQNPIGRYKSALHIHSVRHGCALLSHHLSRTMRHHQTSVHQTTFARLCMRHHVFFQPMWFWAAYFLIFSHFHLPFSYSAVFGCCVTPSHYHIQQC